MAAPKNVRAWAGELVIPTYLPGWPDRNPMFLEKRVYQGSSGRVYPLPFTDRVEGHAVPRSWKVVWLENEYLRAMILPELGGRIHALEDRVRGYDLIYRQPVIKPALVGLAGPWISGGIEFNWPQHHRPATFLPVDWRIEEDADGSATVWCSDHDPMARMKGMHGVCLRPGCARLDLKVRVHNRTPFTQTFLWWANVATRVHEAYQSFFPPDVRDVADHAKRATSAYPRCTGRYYGIDYGARGRHGVPESEQPRKYRPPGRGGAPENGPAYDADDLTFYANIPTPCSYMAMGSERDFFGGYDHRAGAGLVHVANHHVSPGKKQWTWGNHEFGYAWDRNLTDPTPGREHPPYIELMAGVYTDNQPDFSFLQPGETRSWIQSWYPIHEIGPAHEANRDAAVHLDLGRERVRIGVAVTRPVSRASVRLEGPGGVRSWKADLAPGRPLVREVRPGGRRWPAGEVVLRVHDAGGHLLISHAPAAPEVRAVPLPAMEPALPAAVPSVEELYLIGLHLEQYRHATRCPTGYWREALGRDPEEARCHTALGRWHLRRGEFATAEEHFRRAMARWTTRNPNPADGEAWYQLGICLRYRTDALPAGREREREARAREWEREAYAVFYKATWNQAWAGAAYHELARMDAARRDWDAAREHVARALRLDSENLLALNLRSLIERERAGGSRWRELHAEVLALDPLDAWARHIQDQTLPEDRQTRLDIAHDYARAGFLEEAVAVVRETRWAPGDLPTQSWGALPLLAYTEGWFLSRLGDEAAARRAWTRAAAMSPDYCFPARLEEIAVLEAARRACPRDARAPYYLGNLLYDRRRHEEAIAAWEAAARLDPGSAVVWRNLGIGCFNVKHQPVLARRAYEQALRCAPADARILLERDQLWKRTGVPPERRRRELERHADLVAQRDDLTLELAGLRNQAGQHEAAAVLLAERRFQPWEGGEGVALAEHVRTCLALGRAHLSRGESDAAVARFQAALDVPENLGEARHPLASPCDVLYWLGRAHEAAGAAREARACWRRAALFHGDFREMSTRTHGEGTYYSALARRRLGDEQRAGVLLRDLLAYARRLERAPAGIDYFATSLPTMLLFEDDLERRQTTTALFLQALAQLGLGRRAKARQLLGEVLRREPGHARARDEWRAEGFEPVRAAADRRTRGRGRGRSNRRTET